MGFLYFLMKERCSQLGLKKTQWHPAFCSALKLELLDNKEDLNYYPEYGLNTKPILIDLLVITKAADVYINNDIGKIFKGHNIFEYKSPDDSLNIDTFYKGIAYASLYKANGSGVDYIKADDVTISFVRERKPNNLLKHLKADGMTVTEFSKGIYHISGNMTFEIQIIISGELNPKEHIWLTSLTNNLSEKAAKTLVLEAGKLSKKDDMDYADSVLNVALKRNATIFHQIKGVSNDMCEALMELMRPEMEAEIEKRVAEEVAERVAEEVAEKDAEIKELKEKLALLTAN